MFLRHNLETYWAECSKEYILSGGRVDPPRRRFLGEAPYRSAYLDKLAAEFPNLPRGNVGHLDPCLRRWHEENVQSKGQLSRHFSEKMETIKAIAWEARGISADGWTGKKKDLKPILRHFALQRAACP